MTETADLLIALDVQYLVIGGIFNLLKAASYEVEVEVAVNLIVKQTKLKNMQHLLLNTIQILQL
jgi:hypothetical protein